MPAGQPFLEDDPGLVPPEEITEQQKTAFTRIVTTIHDFVLFLRDLYLPEEVILVPPEGGWPEITKESWSSLGKSDEVIDVLRHLTYIDQHKKGDPYEFLPSSGLEDYRWPHHVSKVTSGRGREVVFMTEIPYKPAPAHVIGLAGGGRYVECLLCDCRDGMVYGQGSAVNWVECEKIPIEVYFGRLKERFKQMELLPLNYYEVVKEGEKPDIVFELLKKIFEKHGWPDNYNKESCVAEIKEFGKPKNVLRLQGYL